MAELESEALIGDIQLIKEVNHLNTLQEELTNSIEQNNVSVLFSQVKPPILLNIANI